MTPSPTQQLSELRRLLRQVRAFQRAHRHEVSHFIRSGVGRAEALLENACRDLIAEMRVEKKKLEPPVEWRAWLEVDND